MLNSTRERLFNIRMNTEETSRLDGLASHYGITAAAVVRMLVKRDADGLDIAKKMPSKK